MTITFAVKTWKERWDLVMNDKTFRGTADYTCNYKSGFKNKIRGKSGTIYIKDPAITDQGHFIGYKKISKEIILFDPAPLNGTYGEWLNKDVIDFIKKSTKLSVSIEKSHTQHHEEDTFCATWSLAWLDPEMNNLTKNVTNETSGIKNIFAICKKIADTHKFELAVKRIFSEQIADNFIKRTHEWLTLPLNKSPFLKIFED